MTTKKFLRKVVKNGVEYEIEGQKVFIITEDLVSVTQDATKGVSPYSTSYGYTNIDINANAGIKWVEGAIYSFVVNTEMVVASAYRNVRVRIGNGAYIPMNNRANSILDGSSYMTKGRTQFFVYKTVYETGGALHLNTDTSYSAMSVAEGKTGTATSNRVMRADYLKQIIEYHIGQNLPTVGDGTITLEDEEGNELGSFGVNDTGDTTITIPSGGGSGGDLDIDSVNALIDLKLKDYDSMFRLESGLYKILNAIDESDELGLENGDSRDDIVSNQTSMNKISHCYAVMCYIVSSEYAMSKILGNTNATKEISECWNSISIVAESELVSNLYLLSVNGITYLYTYQTAQDAFFTSPERKLEIVESQSYIIVSNNDLLTFLNSEEIIESVICGNEDLMKIIASDTTKLNIIISNSDYTDVILGNNNILSEVSDNNFFTLFLEDEDLLNDTVSSENGKNRINGYSADSLLPVIYSYTGNLGYNTFEDLVGDSECFEILLANENVMKIVSVNEEMKAYFTMEPVEFAYTGEDQHFTIPYDGNYKLEARGANSYRGSGGYCAGVVTLQRGDILSIMVGQSGTATQNGTYGFGGTGRLGGRSGGGLTGFFTGDSEIGANDAERAIVIAGGSGSGGGDGDAGGSGGGTNGGAGGNSDYGTRGDGGTQTGHGSSGNKSADQFRGGNGSGNYGYGGGGGWRGGNGSQGDGSSDDDKGAGGGSGYVISTATDVVMQNGKNGGNGKAKITQL